MLFQTTTEGPYFSRSKGVAQLSLVSRGLAISFFPHFFRPKDKDALFPSSFRRAFTGVGRSGEVAKRIMADYSDYLSNLMIQCQRSVQPTPDWTYPSSQRPQQFARNSPNSLQWYHNYAWGLQHSVYNGAQSIGATVSTGMPQQSLYTEDWDPPSRALHITPVPPYPPVWHDAPIKNTPGTFVESQQSTMSTTSLRVPAVGDVPVKTEGSEARGLNTQFVPSHPASSNEPVNRNTPVSLNEGLKHNLYNSSSPAAAKEIALVKTEASETNGINVTVPDIPHVPPRPSLSTGTPLLDVVERNTLVRTEASGTRDIDTTGPGVQPPRRESRKQEQNIGGYDNEVLLRCCLKRRIFYEHGAFMKFWTVVQLDFQVETRRTLENARETVLDLLKKRRMERVEEQRTGRAPYPQVLSKIRPLLDGFQEVMDSGVARDTPRRRPTGSFPSGSSTHNSEDCSLGAKPVEERITKVNEKIAQKRSLAEILGGTEAAHETAQRPLKRRAIAEVSRATNNVANSGLSRPRIKEDATSDASDLPSDTINETSEDIDSHSSALDEDDSDGEEVSKNSSLGNSESGQRRASPPVMMWHRRKPAAELVGLKQSIMKILNSASGIIDAIHNFKAGRSVD